MDIDPTIASALGFPKPQYTAVERERRWLCSEVPRSLIRQTLTVTDLYVTGTRLRLRDMRPVDGGPGMLRLSRKADVDATTRLITSIYLPEEELAVLSAALTGARLTKIRHRLHAPSGVLMSVDEFQGDLAGLILAEAEFESSDELAAFPVPSFATREVTNSRCFDGSRMRGSARGRKISAEGRRAPALNLDRGVSGSGLVPRRLLARRRSRGGRTHFGSGAAASTDRIVSAAEPLRSRASPQQSLSAAEPLVR